MNRGMRGVVGTVVLAAVCGEVVLPAARADVAQVAPGVYVAGVPTTQFEWFAAPSLGGKQRQANWCWAACIQMVLNYHGLYVSQEQIVARVYGALVDQPGDLGQMLYALQGWAPDVRGRASQILATSVNITANDVVGDLTNRWPLIVGLKGQPIGHAYVLTAVTFKDDPRTGGRTMQSVVLRDPWPGNPSRVEMSWSEFVARVETIVRVRVVRL